MNHSDPRRCCRVLLLGSPVAPAGFLVAFVPGRPLGCLEQTAVLAVKSKGAPSRKPKLGGPKPIFSTGFLDLTPTWAICRDSLWRTHLSFGRGVLCTNYLCEAHATSHLPTLLAFMCLLYILYIYYICVYVFTCLYIYIYGSS